MNDDVELGAGTIITETAKAVLVRLAVDLSERWVPKSVISDDSEAYSLRSPEGEFVVHRWWAEKEGLA